MGTGLEYVCIPLRGHRRARPRLGGPAACRRPTRTSHGEVYPFAFTDEEDPWVEARGLFPAEGIPRTRPHRKCRRPAGRLPDRGRPASPGETRVVLQGKHVHRPSRLAMTVTGARDSSPTCIVGGGVVPVLTGELVI